MKKKLESLKKDKETKKNGYGGKRKNSGRKKSVERLAYKQLKEVMESHAIESIDIKKLSPEGKVIVEKKVRALAMLDVMFSAGIKGDTKAAEVWFKRTVGDISKLEVSGLITEQRVPTKAERIASMAYYKALTKEEEND